MGRITLSIQLVIICIIALLSVNTLHADHLFDNCVLDNQFPYSNCPFTVAEKKSVRFGNVSGAFVLSDNNELLIRFNHARYLLNIGASWVEGEDDDCDEEDVDSGSDLFELRNLLNSSSEDIAFMVNPDDVREITKIWILDCDVEPDTR